MEEMKSRDEKKAFKEENEDSDMATKRGCHRAGKGSPRKKGGPCGPKLKRSTCRKNVKRTSSLRGLTLTTKYGKISFFRITKRRRE